MAINGNFVERPQRAFSLHDSIRPQLIKQREFARRRDGPQLAKFGVTDRNGRCARSCCRCHSENQRPKSCWKRAPPTGSELSDQRQSPTGPLKPSPLITQFSGARRKVRRSICWSRKPGNGFKPSGFFRRMGQIWHALPRITVKTDSID